MRRIFGAALALAIMASITLIASAQTGSVEVRGHIVGTDEPVAQYHITYHANGGRGSYNGPDVTSGSADTVCSLSETGITRYGFRFTGWNIREDGRGISYMVGNGITLNSDITLYAQWRKITGSGNDRTRPSGSGQTMWDDGITSINDVMMTECDGATALSSNSAVPNPYTGDISNLPLCASLLCVSLAVIMFFLWAERREKRLDAQEL